MFNDELAALRDALTDKDGEIDRLRAENIERMQMPPPIHASTPSNLHTISINLNKSKRHKSKEISKFLKKSSKDDSLYPFKSKKKFKQKKNIFEITLWNFLFT